MNKRGGKGNNIPINLHNEHMNRALKDAVLGLGANVTASRIVSVSRAIENLEEICHKTDKELGMHPSSIHHTTHSSAKDEKMIVNELLNNSKVFDYVPGQRQFFPSHPT